MAKIYSTVLWVVFASSALPAQGALLSLKPARASGQHQLIPTNGIYLPQGGQLIFFDVFISDWAPDLLKVAQAATRVGSYGNSVSTSPLVFPHVSCTAPSQCRTAFSSGQGATCGFVGFDSPVCTNPNRCCDPFFVDVTRPDWVCAGIEGCMAFGDVSSARLGIVFAPEMEVEDDGTEKYLGTIVLEAPADAIGEFNINFRPEDCFVQNERPPGDNNIPRSFRSAKVFIGVQPSSDYPSKSRYLTLNPSVQSTTINPILVTLQSLYHPTRPYPSSPMSDFSQFEGEVRYVGPPTAYVIGDNEPNHTFLASRLQCEPYGQDWSNVHSLAVFGSEILPDSVYLVQIPGDFPFEIHTGRWTDVVFPFEAQQPGTQPDVGDISGMLDRFRNVFGAPSKAQAQLQPNIPDPSRKVGFTDISNAVDAFKGFAYPYEGPSPCP